jgi:hypothetical protein
MSQVVMPLRTGFIIAMAIPFLGLATNSSAATWLLTTTSGEKYKIAAPGTASRADVLSYFGKEHPASKVYSLDETFESKRLSLDDHLARKVGFSTMDELMRTQSQCLTLLAQRAPVGASRCGLDTNCMMREADTLIKQTQSVMASSQWRQMKCNLVPWGGGSEAGGSGYDAGYEWAQDNDIDDPNDCDGNNSSFIEGCEDGAEQLSGED